MPIVPAKLSKDYLESICHKFNEVTERHEQVYSSFMAFAYRQDSSLDYRNELLTTDITYNGKLEKNVDFWVDTFNEFKKIQAKQKNKKEMGFMFDNISFIDYLKVPNRGKIIPGMLYLSVGALNYSGENLSKRRLKNLQKKVRGWGDIVLVNGLKNKIRPILVYSNCSLYIYNKKSIAEEFTGNFPDDVLERRFKKLEIEYKIIQV